MKEAYDILSDPNKRKLYDTYGPEAIKMMEGNIHEVDPRAFFTVLTKAGLMPRLFIISLILIVIGVFLLPTIFLCIKWDDSVSWSWIVTFIPAFVYYGVVFLAMTFVCRVPKPEEGEEFDDHTKMEYRLFSIHRWSWVLSSSLIIVFLVLLALRFDGSIDSSYLAVFAPLYAFVAVSVAQAAVVLRLTLHMQRQADEEARTHGIEPPPNTHFRSFVTGPVLRGLVQLLQLLLIAAHAQGDLSTSWWVIAVPLWVAFGLSCCAICVGCTGSDEKRAAASSLCVNMVWVLAIVIMFVAKLQYPSSLSAFVVFIPLFLLFGCLCCCLGSFILCAREDMMGGQASHTDVPGGGGAGSEPEGPHGDAERGQGSAPAFATPPSERAPKFEEPPAPAAFVSVAPVAPAQVFVDVD